MKTRKALSFDDALIIAQGCTDYGGGYWAAGESAIYQHGIQTVINALDHAREHGLNDSQILALYRMGKGQSPAAEQDANASLVAAAPDLLEALEYAVSKYGAPGGPWNVPSDPGGWLERARAAITKAKGGQL